MALIYIFLSQLMLCKRYFHVNYFFINNTLFYVIYNENLRFLHLYPIPIYLLS